MRSTTSLLAFALALLAGCNGAASPNGTPASKGATSVANPAGTTPGTTPATSPGTPPAPSVPPVVSPAPPATPPAGTNLATGPVFPATNPWNTDISKLPVHANSANFIASIGVATPLHPDFGTTYNGVPNGIPYVIVSAGQPPVQINLGVYASESDPGPYPVPPTAPIEGGPNGTGDRHVLVLDKDAHKLYEMDNAVPGPNNSWSCNGGAIFDLTSNNLRPLGWTSADAAGLPIFPGLVRFDEAVTAKAINHALRFTVVKTQHGYILPATHYASSNTSANLPPMGLRLRLKVGVDISKFPPEVQVILTALKTYGMFVADNGGNLFLSGAPDANWNDSNLNLMKQITANDFEAVDTGPIVTK